MDFAIGDVAAVNKAGQSRPVAKGAEIEEGETINTNSGRTQLRFSDGAFVSLQPQSAFRIDQYRYDGKQDGSEKTFLSLLKGGLRTVTGLVGRSNKKNYQVSTTVATIGFAAPSTPSNTANRSAARSAKARSRSAMVRDASMLPTASPTTWRTRT